MTDEEEFYSDHPSLAKQEQGVFAAIDRGGGQTCDIAGVIRELNLAGFKIIKALSNSDFESIRPSTIEECAAVADKIARIYHEDPAERVAAEWIASDIRSLSQKKEG